MPTEIVSNTPKISILGFEEILIENYKNIIEYENFYIKINTYKKKRLLKPLFHHLSFTKPKHAAVNVFPDIDRSGVLIFLSEV